MMHVVGVFSSVGASDLCISALLSASATAVCVAHTGAIQIRLLSFVIIAVIDVLL